MASTTSSLIVRLVDQVSGPARGVSRSLDRMQAGIRGASVRNAAALGAMRGKLVDAVVTTTALATALGKPIAAASEFQSKLLDIAQKANMTGEESGKLKTRMLQLSEQFGKSGSEMAATFDNLIGKGLDTSAADRIVGPIAKVATAYRGSMDDIASAGFSVMSNLKVPADQVEKAFEAMAEAGKRGAFELRDMATEFPSITGQAQTMGITGTKGVARLSAALQIARKLTATGSEAATNIGDLMGKITAPEAIKKFGKAGVDIQKIMDDTRKSGADPFEAMAGALNKATKGDQSRIGNFLQDKQARQAGTALVQNIGEYRQIRDAADAAVGGIDKDFAARQQTMAAGMERFSAAMERMSVAIGDGLVGPMQRFLNTLDPIVSKVTEFASKNPKLVGTLGSLAATLVAVNVGLLGFKYAGLLMGGQMIALASGALKLIRPLQLVKSAFTGIRIAIASTGIGAVLLLLAAAGTWIYRNWTGITQAVGGFADAIKSKFPGLEPFVTKVGGWIQKLFDIADKLTGPIDATAAQWRQFGTDAGNAVSGLVDKILALPGRITSALSALPGQLQQAGADAINALWVGMSGAFDNLIAGVKARVSEAAGAIKSLGGLIPGSTQPAGMPAAGTAPNRATATSPPGRFGGGPVSKGRPYTVGERGRETFWPSQSGRITRGGAGGVTFNAAVTVNGGSGDPQAVARAVSAELSKMVDAKFRGGHADMGLAFT